ncbi:MAG: chemotaxis protein CheD [Bacteroidota bacterium]
MINNKTDIAKQYLYPSNLFVTDKPTLVTTVLGSCIAICLFDKVNKIAGINHFMLPYWNGEGLASAKYGNIANDKLLTEMLRMGASRKHVEAKVFGGANQANFTMNIGARNTEIAMKFLEDQKIPVIAESVKGHLGRKIIFDTSNGVVKMKLIHPRLQKVE